MLLRRISFAFVPWKAEKLGGRAPKLCASGHAKSLRPPASHEEPYAHSALPCGDWVKRQGLWDHLSAASCAPGGTAYRAYALDICTLANRDSKTMAAMACIRMCALQLSLLHPSPTCYSATAYRSDTSPWSCVLHVL